MKHTYTFYSSLNEQIMMIVMSNVWVDYDNEKCCIVNNVWYIIDKVQVSEDKFMIKIFVH